VNQGILLRDPTAETASALRPRVQPLDTLQGRTVALMDIGKMRGDEFIDRLEVLCRDRGIATRRYRKPTNTRVAPRAMIQEIAAHCQAVVIALSDCGSCTSCSTHDLNDLDKRGLTGVSVLTTEFAQAFESQRTTIGLDAASVYVSHPMQNKTTAELHRSADLAFAAILRAITAEANLTPRSEAA
jgi:hypothetical protein